MACENISKSRLLGCKSNFSGIKAVSFMPYTKLTLTTGICLKELVWLVQFIDMNLKWW
jgi:hypothetical protein